MKIILSILLMLITVVCFGQSETNNFITYDTVFKVPGYPTGCAMRISRPLNMFTVGNADTASRPVIITMPGSGEMGTRTTTDTTGLIAYTNTLKTYLDVWGPHYFLSHGWDGGVQLANGKHFPILITFTVTKQNIRPWEIDSIMKIIRTVYHIKNTSVHTGGLSMGGWTWGRYICYAKFAGDENAMSKITSNVSLQGVANDNFSGFNLPGWAAFGRWANRYGGKFFGLEGTTDTRQVWRVSQNMNDSVANSAYFSFEKIGGGGHGFWNSMYDTGQHDWRCIPTITNTSVIATNVNFPNTMGTYKDGSSIFQWMLRQGDTTLVGSGTATLRAVAGDDQTIILPTNSTSLNGDQSTGAIASYLWTRISGPNTPNFGSATSVSTTYGLSGTPHLIAGDYTIELKVQDAGAGVSKDTMVIHVLAAPNTPPVANAGVDRTIIIPQDTAQLHGSATDVDGTITNYTWTNVTGGTLTFNPSTSASTGETFIGGITDTGTFTIRLTVTDDLGATDTDDMILTVIDTASAPSEGAVAKRIDINIYNPSLNSNAGFYNSVTPYWNNWNVVGTTSITNLLYEDGTLSAYTVSQPSTSTVSDNGANYGSGIYPQVPLRQASYGAGTKDFTISGLIPTKRYNVVLVGSRANPGTSTKYTVNGTTQTLITYNNFDNSAGFLNIAPSGSTIVFTVQNGSTYWYLNMIILEEIGSVQPNLPPSVDAGADQTISLPLDSVTVTGTVTDEGGALAYSWVKISGPAGDIIRSDSTVSTIIAGLGVGTYTYQLNVTDTGGLTGSARTHIVVNAAGNTPPTVNAGVDQTITLPTSSTTLVAVAADPGGSIASYLWRKISGSVNGTPSPTNTATTTVSGLIQDVYVYEITVTDNLGSIAKDTVSVTVSPAAIPATTSVSVGSGEYQTLFIDSIGHLWGIGNLTNIGVNNTGTAGIPARCKIDATHLLDTVFASACGGLHGAAAVDNHGYVWTMGDNDQGQLGNGTTTATNLPVKILIDSTGNDFTGVVKIMGFFLIAPRSANGFYAIKSDGTLWAWGRLIGGMRGNGTDSTHADSTAYRPVQIVMPGGRLVKDISIGRRAMAVCTDGTLWTWGYNVTDVTAVGYTVANTKEYQTPHQIALSNVTLIAGSGDFQYAYTADNKLYGWGRYGNQMGDLAFPTNNGTVYALPRELTNITNNLPVGRTIVKIATDFSSTHVILDNGELWGWGSNDQGNVGNGVETNWATYPTPYAWDNTLKFFQKLPVRIAPGILFSDVYGGNVYNYYKYAKDVNGRLYSWGRNKSAVQAVQQKIASSLLDADRQSAIDRKWITLVDPFHISAVYLSTSPDCISTPGVSPCSSYTPPANTPPTANAGNDTTVYATSTFTLNGTASTDNVFVAYYEWSEVSGPTNVVMSLTGNAINPIAGLVPGVYTFKLTVTDNGWSTDTDNIVLTVGDQAPGKTQKRGVTYKNTTN